MDKKVTIITLTCFFLLLIGCGDDVVTLPAEVCQVTCTDDATGDTYGIAFRALVWNNQDDPYDIGDDMDWGCYYYIDAYQGKIGEDGEFEDEDGDGQAKFWTSGLVGAKEEFTYDDYTLSFTDNNFDTEHEPLEDYLFYQLLDESTIQITQSISSIAAEYVHKINPCAYDAQLTLRLFCTRDGDGHAYIDCLETPESGNYYQGCDGCGEDKEIKCTSEAASCIDDINYEDLEDNVQALAQEAEEAIS